MIPLRGTRIRASGATRYLVLGRLDSIARTMTRATASGFRLPLWNSFWLALSALS